MSPTPDGVSILSKNACCAKAPESAQSLHVSRWNLDRQNVAQVRIKEALHKLRMQRFAALVIKSCRRHLLQNAKEMQKASCRAMHSLGILEIDRFLNPGAIRSKSPITRDTTKFTSDQAVEKTCLKFVYCSLPCFLQAKERNGCAAEVNTSTFVGAT